MKRLINTLLRWLGITKTVKIYEDRFFVYYASKESYFLFSCTKQTEWEIGDVMCVPTQKFFSSNMEAEIFDIDRTVEGFNIVGNVTYIQIQRDFYLREKGAN